MTETERDPLALAREREDLLNDIRLLDRRLNLAGDDPPDADEGAI